jgi:hypothetical protein
MEKLELAEKLVQDKDENKYNKGLDIYINLCLDMNMNPNYRLTVLSSLMKYEPNEGRSILSQLRDMIPHLRGRILEDLLKILIGVTRSSKFDSHERVTTAVNLYNNKLFNVCYTCFSDLANDRTLEIEYRVEAARYLFGSDIEENLEVSTEALMEIINNMELSSNYRYGIIAGFISKTGINTRLNNLKLKVPYNEEFVHRLQTSFFENEKNNPRERILSGQHLLQMYCLEEDQRTKVIELLYDIAKNEDLEENLRADAADVLLRLCKGKYSKLAREIIVSMGKKPTGSALQQRSKDIYSDSQNIHNESIDECISGFIEKIINETDNVKIRPYDEVHQEICTTIRRITTKSNRKNRALAAMNRILLDTAEFTKHRVTLSELLVHVWIRIQQYSDEEREELEKRLVDELTDMSDTCSSGHSGRLVNVLSVYDSALIISWEDQIKSNLSGRIQAKIRNLEDEDLQATISLGAMEDSDKEDREVYISFINKTLVELHEELYKEFVGDGYISEEDFNKAFDEAKKSWVE